MVGKTRPRGLLADPLRPLPRSAVTRLLVAALLGGTQAAVLDDPDLRELLLPIIRNDYRLIDRYRRSTDAPRLRADLLALTGDRDPQVTVEQARGWAATTDGAFSLHVLAGDHFYLVPAAAEVARLTASVYPSTAGNT
ncbi:thioesterase domain-containing protein [Kitasatospora sp. NPDC096128]|uniref:thioesterase II family protein n=1 Tax=Kitasatospora sp. NPDC096128 TaxID=3155547 RepID=UPI003326F963